MNQIIVTMIEILSRNKAHVSQTYQILVLYWNSNFFAADTFKIYVRV